MLARLLTLLALAAIAAVPAAQSAPPATQTARPRAQSGSLAAPTELRTFLLRADEPTLDSFPRTPSFAWAPYEGAQSYDFELATSKRFDESTIVWSTNARTRSLKVPAVTIPLALPWMNGAPYALYAHVRARTTNGVTRWSAPFGFNMRSEKAPEQLLPSVPGLVRWRPVDGATSYEVWFVDIGKVITTTTNVADEREYFTFQDPSRSAIVQWRVRAVRKLYGGVPNGLPAVSYGPWSNIFVSTNLPPGPGPLRLIETSSDVRSTSSSTQTHTLTPGFAFTGNTATNGQPGRLYRVYVATDRQCVNTVFTGSVVGSPAYAPRTSGPLALPPGADVTANGNQSGTLAADQRPVTTNEQTSSTPSVATGTTTPAPATTTSASALPPVDLWDIGSPNGRYYWTVVPVREVLVAAPSSGTTTGTTTTTTGTTTTGTTTTGSTGTTGSSTVSVQYVDAEVPQDACTAGRVIAFGKMSQPVTTSATRPYVSGLSPSGGLVAAQNAHTSFYRAVLATWEPAPGAVDYEVQWSKTRYPWRNAAPGVHTAATSMLLEGLAPGTWYYRVRGIDPYSLGPLKQMTWSAPIQIRLAKPTFLVQSGVTTRPVKK
jgi:hypothetical protein